LGNAIHYLRYFRIGRLRQSLKSNFLIFILIKNTIGNQAVQVDIEIDRVMLLET
jgi:hypothetical protein